MAPRSPRAPFAIAVTTFAVGACAGPRSELVFDTTVSLSGARFAGPITVDVPRRKAYGGRDLEYVVELEARCTPALQVGYPDGEVGTVGARDTRWQELLAQRAAAGGLVGAAAGGSTGASAEGSTGASEPASSTGTGTLVGNAPGAATPTGPGAPGTVAVTVTAPIVTGRWERVATESWPGQLQFQAERGRRCQAGRRWSRRYLTGLDETGQLTVWADTPQELEGARLTVRVYAVGEIARPPVAPSAPPPRRPTVTVRADAEVQVRVRPPQPPPRRERPGTAEAAGAIWRPGSWQWADGQGTWVWIDGSWGPPASTPPLQNDDRGALPAPGAQWKNGHWVWVTTSGAWRWIPGEWLAPPPLVENPGPPPVPEQEWIAGFWFRTGATFTWTPGRWGRPRPRVETPPPPPSRGARWVAGSWLRKGETWLWSPGYYERVGRPPPPPRVESPPPRPVPDAVWLAGFWRWDAARNDHAWVPGYWELPPGEGYAWVWDEVPAVTVTTTPGAPSTQGVRRSGRWILKVDLDVDLKARVPGGRR